MADTYMEEVWEQQAIKNWSKPLHNFGVRQNAFNQSADRRIRELESENLQLRAEVRTLLQQTEELSQITKRQKDRLRQEENRNREIFGRVAAQMDKMQAEINRLRLSTQLNSNAIDRLLLQGKTELEEEMSETAETVQEEQIEATEDFEESVTPTEENPS
ncbi:MAG: hypothetical protein PUB72_09610 [Ruminococcus sp.]|nr:hypothetical protein [Ruminococcus sp.]